MRKPLKLQKWQGYVCCLSTTLVQVAFKLHETENAVVYRDKTLTTNISMLYSVGMSISQNQEANSHYSPVASITLCQEKQSVCQCTKMAEFPMVENHPICSLGTTKFNRNHNRGNKKEKQTVLYIALISSPYFLCCTCKKHHAHHGRAFPHIAKSRGAI